MKILFIAPIPPPINGQSKASKVLLDSLLQANHDVSVINLSKGSLKSGLNSLERVFEVINILIKVWKHRSGNDWVYLSLSESFFGNIKDIFIFLIFIKSRKKMLIHMLGGAGMEKILAGHGIRGKINYYLMSGVGGVIVEGPAGFKTFTRVLPQSKIHIVPNFSEDFLFVNDEEIKFKFSNNKIINILYLSNLISGKGYDELADAYIALDDISKKQVNIVFVGGFAPYAISLLF